MSTPTTVKFQIAVPSTDGNGGAEKIYTLTLSLLVEGSCEGEIRVTLMNESEIPEGVTALGGGMPVVDPNPDETTDSQSN